MSELWKGFAGLVAAFGLAYFVLQIEDDRADEHTLIYETAPEQQAEEDFNEGRYYFYQIRATRYNEEGDPVRYWLLRGKPKIDTKILEDFPDRYNFKSSDHHGFTSEQNHFNRKAMKWTLLYNLRLAELLSKKKEK